MAIGTNGLFSRGIGITGAGLLGMFSRALLGGSAPLSTGSALLFWRRRRRG